MSSLNISSLESIKFNDTLKSHSDIHSIIEVLVKRIKDIPSFESLHLNVDLIVYVCKIIDQILVDSKLKDVNKYELFKEIYMTVYPETTEKELRTIKCIIEYLHNIKEIVAVKTNYQKVCRSLKSCLKVVLSVLSLS